LAASRNELIKILIMNKYKLLTLLIALLLITKTFAQTDSLPVKNIIKLGLPLTYNGLFAQYFSAGLQYERLINAKNSLSLSVDYLDSEGNRFFPALNKERGDKSLIIMPQWRHYLGKNKDTYFNGFYVGGQLFISEVTSIKETLFRKVMPGA
jgi:hypothetical protein